MGEIADEHYDRMVDDGHRFYNEGVTIRRAVRCQHCGSRDVRWFRDSAGWRLYNTADSELHNCLTGAAPSAEGFSDVG